MRIPAVLVCIVMMTLFSYSFLFFFISAVSDELKQSLLELVCFYNGKDGKSDEYLDEKWYTANQRTIARKTWQ